jgi:hypothetical protein
MSDVDAESNTRTLMTMRETGQAVGLAYLAEGDIEPWERYKYKPFQFELLVKAWMPIVQSTGLKVNKWVNLLFWEGMATGPLAMTALKARQLRLENDRLKEQLYNMQVQQAARDFAAQNNGTGPAATAAQPQQGFNRMNYDSKRAWEVDNNGFFTHGWNGSALKYIEVPKRKEKPLLRPEVYEKLIQFNGKEVIVQIFKVNPQ